MVQRWYWNIFLWKNWNQRRGRRRSRYFERYCKYQFRFSHKVLKLCIACVEEVRIIHFILLSGARLSDSGNIKCIATNLLGKAASNAQLMIEGTLIQTIMKPSRILVYKTTSLCSLIWLFCDILFSFTAFWRSPRI